MSLLIRLACTLGLHDPHWRDDHNPPTAGSGDASAWPTTSTWQCHDCGKILGKKLR